MTGAQRRRGLPRYRDTDPEPTTATAQVTMDEKAALWLYAFFLRDPAEQQQDARAHLASLI